MYVLYAVKVRWLDDWIGQQLDHQHNLLSTSQQSRDSFIPQTMIVDQELIKKALLLASINDRVDGVVIFGGKGTGKLIDTYCGYAGSYRQIMVFCFPHSSTVFFHSHSSTTL
jgi:hypothetical protein